MTASTRLVLHVGAPKTGTTTLQRHVFPFHPEISYVGKFIPSMHYVDQDLHGAFMQVTHQDSMNEPNLDWVADRIEAHRLRSDRPVLLLSSEAFVHPSARDLGQVARRLHRLFPHARILVTIREQSAFLMSFWAFHARQGSYVSFGGHEPFGHDEPWSFSRWLQVQVQEPRNTALEVGRFHDIVELYATLFTGPVTVLPMELMDADPDSYSGRLSGCLGVDVETTRELLTAPRENVGGPGRPWGASDVSSLLDLPSSEILAGYLRECAPGNLALEMTYALPLAELGYSCVAASS